MSLPPSRSFLFVIDQLSSGGAQQQMVLLAREFVQLGNQVQFLVYRRNDFHAAGLAKIGIPVEVVERRSRYSLAFVRRIAEKIRSESFDGILSFLTGPNLYALLGRWRSGRKVPVVISERSSANNPNKSLFHAAAERFYPLADRVVVNSYHQREFLAQKYPKLDAKLRTIWNGVDLERFRPSPLPDTKPGFHFVAVGQIGKFKQPECVIRALAIVRERLNQPVEVSWFARRFPNLTRAEAAQKIELDRLIIELSLQEHFHWKPETAVMEQELPKFHALIHASIVEGLPNAVCEALASGRPVLASDTLDHPRLISSGRSGFLFEKSSPQALAEVMIKYCQLSSNARQAMAIQAAEFAQHAFSPKVFGERYLALFQELP
ncbi:MAG: glycosyltransferase family 4 protein [Pirellulaceae bacterium]